MATHDNFVESPKLIYGSIEGVSLTKQIDSLDVGETLLFRSSPNAPEPPEMEVTYQENPDYQKGRGNSVMGVAFADMQLGEFSQPVALKKLGPAWKISEEIRLATKLNSIGADGYNVSSNPVTFVPIGAYRSTDGKLGVLTRFEQAVVSFDNTFWNQQEPPTEQRIEYGMASAAAVAIFLHSEGYAHGDLQVKNTAADTIGSRVIDISSMKARNKSHPEYVPSYVEDIADYIRSLKVDQPEPDNGVTAEHVREFFLEPYTDCIEDIFPYEIAHIIGNYIKSLDIESLLRSRLFTKR